MADGLSGSIEGGKSFLDQERNRFGSALTRIGAHFRKWSEHPTNVKHRDAWSVLGLSTLIGAGTLYAFAKVSPDVSLSFPSQVAQTTMPFLKEAIEKGWRLSTGDEPYGHPEGVFAVQSLVALARRLATGTLWGISHESGSSIVHEIPQLSNDSRLALVGQLEELSKLGGAREMIRNGGALFYTLASIGLGISAFFKQKGNESLSRTTTGAWFGKLIELAGVKIAG